MSLDKFSADLDAQYLRLRNALSAKSRDHEWRRSQLLNFKRMMHENDDAISKAVWKDLHKNKVESVISEQAIVVSEINDALKNLKKWMRPKQVSTPFYNWPGCSQIVHEPFGLCLIIGAWNYPINLLLAPLVGALAAGNLAVLKPSELATETAKLVGEIIPKYFDSDTVIVLQGGPDETSLILDKAFDLIFFTGSGTVGKIILSKAAQHLTPVVLELGGKSPAVVLPDCDLEITAKRIAWGKFLNSGQTCIAPDYIIVHPSIKASFVAAVQKYIKSFFGSDIARSEDYGRIVNQRNFDRLLKLMPGSEIISGGKSNRDELFIEPTLCVTANDSPLMTEEIFGPILPIVEIAEVSKIIEFINDRPKPLALYVFTNNSQTQSEFIQKTSSGALCLNDNVMHMPESSLPFGGVGASGMGHYHGKFSFETFSHAKGVLKRSFWPDFPLRYPPYTPLKEKVLRWLLE